MAAVAAEQRMERGPVEAVATAAMLELPGLWVHAAPGEAERLGPPLPRPEAHGHFVAAAAAVRPLHRSAHSASAAQSRSR